MFDDALLPANISIRHAERDEVDPDRILGYLNGLTEEFGDAAFGANLFENATKCEAIIALRRHQSHRANLKDREYIAGVLVRANVNGIDNKSLMSGAFVGQKKSRSAIMRELINAGADRGWLLQPEQSANLAVIKKGLATANRLALGAKGFRKFGPDRHLRAAIAETIGSNAFLSMREGSIESAEEERAHTIKRAIEIGIRAHISWSKGVGAELVFRREYELVHFGRN